jgi:glycosyltransferase involved in cell wall biosynthesis
MSIKPEIKLLSVIIPVGTRYGDARTLYREYKAGLAALTAPAEILFVLDGPRPKFAAQLEELLAADEQFTIVTLTRSFGMSAALMAGVERAAGDAIITLPAYQQIEAGDIRKLVAALDTVDVAVAMRTPRTAGLFDRLRRSLFHRLLRSLTGLQFHDLGCSARAVRRRVFDELDLYGEQHRFLPVVADRLGFTVAEIGVRQSAHDRLERVYRPREYARHALDLFSIFFLVRFTKRPLRFFGMLGATTFSVGAAIIVYLCVERLMFDQELADRPALLLATLLVVLGMQIFALGLLGELIIFTHARDLKDYRVEEVIEYQDSPLAPSTELGSSPVVHQSGSSAIDTTQSLPLATASPHAAA